MQVISGGIADVERPVRHHSYALRTDGTVASWGRNYRAELGDGNTTTPRHTPGAASLGVSDAVVASAPAATWATSRWPTAG